MFDKGKWMHCSSKLPHFFINGGEQSAARNFCPEVRLTQQLPLRITSYLGCSSAAVCEELAEIFNGVHDSISAEF